MDIEEKLRTAADRHEADRERVERQLAAVDRRRDDVIRWAAAKGLTRRKIAGLVRLSHQRVDQIVRGGKA